MFDVHSQVSPLINPSALGGTPIPRLPQAGVRRQHAPNRVLLLTGHSGGMELARDTQLVRPRGRLLLLFSMALV